MADQAEENVDMSNITEDWKAKYEEARAELLEFQQVTAQMDDDMEQEITQLQQENAEASERAKQFEAKYKTLKEQSGAGTAELTEQLIAMQDKLQQANEYLEELKREKRDNEIRTEQLEATKRRYEAELEDQKEKLESAVEDQVVLQGDLQDATETKDREIQQLQEELSNVKGESALLRSRLAALENGGAQAGEEALQSKVADLEAKLSETEQQVEDLESDMEEASNDLMGSESRAQELETKLQEALAALEAEQNRTKVVSSRGSLSATEDMDRMDLEVLRTQIQDKQSEVERLRAAKDALQAELAEQRLDNQYLSQDAQQAASTLQQAEERAKALDKEKQELSRAVEKLEKQLAENANKGWFGGLLGSAAADTKATQTQGAVIARSQLQTPLLSLDNATKGLKSTMTAWKAEMLTNQQEFSALHSQLANALQAHFSSVEREHARELESQQLKQLQLVNELAEHKGGNIRVVCRVRPLLPYETKKGAVLGDTVELAPDGKAVTLIRRDADTGQKDSQHFFFDKVCPPSDGNADAFAQVKDMLDSVLFGHNVCIFAYGQTGSGKTHTMEGSAQEAGISFRSAEYLFSLMEQRKAHFNFAVRITLVEIYNEQLRDLLREVDRNKADGLRVVTPSQAGLSTPSKLSIRHDKDGRTYVLGASYVEATSADQVVTLLSAANAARAEASTALNTHSSRSHLVLTLTVTSTNTHTLDVAFGKLCLVDLAGSERVKMSEAVGKQLEEATFINKSLSALGNVMLQLTSTRNGGERPHVPFRDSKLTYMLQDALQGNSKTLMFVNVSPAQLHSQETLCSLQFAKRVRKVKLGASTASVENGALVKYKQELDQQKLETVKLKKRLEGERDKLRDELKEKDASFSKLERKLKELGSQGSNAKGELRDRLESERLQAQKAERKLLQEVKQLKSQLQDSKAELDKSNQRLTSTKEQLHQQERLQKGGDAANTEIRRQAETIRKLKKKLDLAEKAAKSHQERRADTRGEVSSLKQQMSLMEDEHRRVLEAKDREIRELRRNVSSTPTTQAPTGPTSSGAVPSAPSSGSKSRALQAENRRLKVALDDLNNQLRAAKLASSNALRKAGAGPRRNTAPFIEKTTYVENGRARTDSTVSDTHSIASDGASDVSEASNVSGTQPRFGSSAAALARKRAMLNGARSAREGARPSSRTGNRPSSRSGKRSGASTPLESPLHSPRLSRQPSQASQASQAVESPRVDTPSRSPIAAAATAKTSPPKSANSNNAKSSSSNGLFRAPIPKGGNGRLKAANRNKSPSRASTTSKSCSTPSSGSKPAVSGRSRGDRTGGLMRPTAASSNSKVKRPSSKDKSNIVKPIVLRGAKKANVAEDEDEDEDEDDAGENEDLVDQSAHSSPRRLDYEDENENEQISPEPNGVLTEKNVQPEQQERASEKEEVVDSGDPEPGKENSDSLAPGFIRAGGAILVAPKRPAGRRKKVDTGEIKAGKTITKKGATLQAGIKEKQQQRTVTTFDASDISNFSANSIMSFSGVEDILAGFDKL
eukprot:g73561.t1